ncbi:DUF4382 domain-containing protein [Mongoliibacter ruber]|uniref:Uncharacterized protein DUF4382 n=1 Tax=Mongoliibacter ruber TaxID=1750599 RepID=A0A2T0WGW6_9BACT|nr:DUF4382 domain-containing protein [Mongoliibacter ruber]PRY85936.1 uncharacterized protein DUF4382 [Mongoliibacter ruber]
MNKLLLPLIFAILLFSGCSSDTERTTALVNVFLIDAPGDFDEVWVEVLGVEVQAIGTRGQDNADPKFFPNDQVIKLVNVAALVGGNQFLIGRGELPAGSITGLTLKLGNNNFALADEERTNLTLSEDSPSIDLNLTLDPGLSIDVFIDFELYRSIHSGAGDIVELRPKLRAFSSLNTGRISGSIRPQSEKVVLYAIQNRDTVASTGTVENSGDFQIRGLSGNFRVIVQPLDPAFLSDTLNNVNVGPRQTTQVGNITLRPRED